MTSFAIQHGLMPMYTGQILTTDRSQLAVDANNYRQANESTKTSVGKYGKIKDGLEASISIEGKGRITRIINEVKQMSDVEKLLLYLKLPTGGLTEDHQRLTPPSCLQASNRAEQAQALTWIKSHLEEHSDVCLPKQEVYDDYKTYCENHSLRPLCNPDFGKMMKYAFPDVVARRLGKRGQSKYFYGGLRKKIDVAPPVLPELQVQVKHTEDESKENGDLLLAAGQVVCEWAQKLLEQNFTGLRDLAEHLVGNLYVGSKSVAAFTVIAAMQESGSQTGKNSALFSASNNNAVDKHRETQLQLQRKLQEKKLLEEQKRKMNLVREENEQQLRANSSLGRKTPVTPRIPSRTSANVERKTPKIPSTPSPLPLQSPRKFQSNLSFSQSAEHVQPAVSSQSENEKSVSECDDIKATIGSHEISREKEKGSSESDNENHGMCDNTEENVFTFPKPVVVSNDDSKTPEHCQMEIEELPSHVRRIDFGKVKNSTEKKNDKDVVEFLACNSVVHDNSYSDKETHNKLTNESDSEMIDNEDKSMVKPSRDSGSLSQSAGHVSLKMLLERKDVNENHLNKSLGFVSTRNTNLFPGQSNNLSRSAFVPFSQSRKEATQHCSSISSEASSSLVSYRQTVCSNSIESMPKSATITITPVFNLNQGASNTVDPVNRPPDNIIHIQPGNAYHDKELNVTDKTVVVENKNLNSSSVIVSGPNSNGDELSNSVTNPTIVQSGSAAQDLKALSYHVSPGANKQIKTPRFTPIKPKSSPQKASTYTKAGTDIPAYDKRPVSAILKEKREREKAEALAKIQASIKLPTIQSIPGLQFQQVPQALTLNAGQVRNIAPLPTDMLKLQTPGNLNTKDVVIFVNNTSVASSVPAVIATSSNQCLQKQVFDAADKELISLTEEQKTPETESILKTSISEENKDTEESNESGNERDHTPSIEDIFTAKEDDINPKELHEKGKPESMEIERYSEQKSEESDNGQEDIFEDKLDVVESQTPIKIAKLNVDSPFRSESACSLGRETPIKIMKISDFSVGRPESACSHGRETPSGGRKRKSSGNTQQRNFKRLNSTGEVEDSEIYFDSNLGSNLLEPQKKEIRLYNQRRTHSCTLELEKDKKQTGFGGHQKSVTLDTIRTSLQSPDISSLEREALIDAFPHTVCSIKPSKQSVQKSSVGISSESFRNALKLKKQQEYLNDRVNTFLMKENTVKEAEIGNEQKVMTGRVNLVGNGLDLSRESKEGFNMGVKDKEMESESGIPSDVADFINETIEKRQSANNSVMSEPNIATADQARDEVEETLDKVEKVGPLVTDNVKFLGVNIMNTNKRNETVEQLSQKQHVNQNKKDDLFTVPKVPPFNFKMRDNNVRFSTPDMYSSHQRCSSLPTFTSPVSFPLSPQGRQGVFHKSSSVSPITGQSPDREISNMSLGALGRVEVRENHPISVNIHPNLNATNEGTFLRPNSLPIRNTHHDEKVSQTAPYLASIQHSLQKPRETPVDQRQLKQKDSPKEKQNICFSPVGNGQLSRESSAERVIFTPFSDRGYHSIGSSPVLNSTPVSLPDVETSTATGQSPGHTPSINIGLLSPSSYVSSASLSPQVHMGQQLTGSGGGPVVSINQLNTSTTSAFIPIQGSSNEIRYVTPIRPMATVASEKIDGPVVNPDGKNQEIQNILNRAQDPPSYEYAMRQKKQRESTNSAEMVNNSECPDNLIVTPDTGPVSNERISLLATMGQRSDQNNMKQMGPCATRLAQLSRQSKQNTNSAPSNSHPSIISALNQPAKDIGQFFISRQGSINDDSMESTTPPQHMIGDTSCFISSQCNTNDLVNVAGQDFDVSELPLETARQNDVHTHISNSAKGEEKVTNSFHNIHSSNISHQLSKVELNQHDKIFDPSLGVLSSQDMVHASSNVKVKPPAPHNMISNLRHKHSSLSSGINNFGHNIHAVDPYQEYNDPLGNTLEDLKEILSDRSVVGDNGFYSETDISTSEEGISDLLFGDE